MIILQIKTIKLMDFGNKNKRNKKKRQIEIQYRIKWQKYRMKNRKVRHLPKKIDTMPVWRWKDKCRWIMQEDWIIEMR